MLPAAPLLTCRRSQHAYWVQRPAHQPASQPACLDPARLAICLTRPSAVQVRASSPSCRTTDPHRLCSSQFSRNSVAKPQLGPAGQRLTWWLLDLGTSRLACDHYTLRADGSVNYPRSWALQGCRDPAADCWIDLQVREQDASLQMPGQYHSWPVTGPASRYPFRLLRLVQTASSAPHMSQAGAMCLSNFEFYGWLTQTEVEQKEA